MEWSRRRRRNPRRPSILILVGCLIVLGSACADSSLPPAVEGAGANGLNDPVVPNLGNGGYDVSSYDISFAFDPESRAIDAQTTVTFTATQMLSRFNLELSGFDVSQISIDGEPVSWERFGVEVAITPERPLEPGEVVAVSVDYAGVPQPLDSDAFGENGWFDTGDVVVVAGQPDGAASWFPVNDHPSDKATYTIEMTLPESYVAGANGVEVGATTADGETTWRFESRVPQASYLTTVIFGENVVRIDSPAASDGTRIRHYFEDSIAGRAEAIMAPTADMIDFFVDIFGPFPFDVYGAAVVDAPLGFALETQTLSVFDPGTLEEWVVAHEVAHQWVGNHVSLDGWEDIWLNEGLANYAEQLWFDHSIPDYSIDDTLRARIASGEFDLDRAPGSPTADTLFSDASYYRGGMTLHALRRTIGDDDFFELLPSWVEMHGGGNVTTADFIALAERISGQDLDGFFDAWLYTDEMPELPE